MEEDEDMDDSTSWMAEAHFTNANYQAKKMVFLLFINRAGAHSLLDSMLILFSDRLVESSRVKRTLEAVYSGVLPKGASPFVYLRYRSLFIQMKKLMISCLSACRLILAQWTLTYIRLNEKSIS